MKIMKKSNIHKYLLALFAALLLCPFGASSQTVRGDFDYDGDFDISDLTLLINYLVNDIWNDEPIDLVRDTVMVNGEMIVMVSVEGGILEHDDGWMFRVDDFWICKTEVTAELWAAVMGGTSDGQHKASRNHSWNDCQAFIEALNALTGRQFRLPNSTEWEYAARGGNRSRGYTYCGGNNIDVVGWYKDNSPMLMPVGLLKCNELGLYDMSGNVSEFCQDGPNEGPNDSRRYACGGNDSEVAAYQTPTSRRSVQPDWVGYNYGMRLAM